MKRRSYLLIAALLISLSQLFAGQPLKLLVVTGGHGYNKQTFNEMLNSLGPGITWEVAEFPKAFDMFLPENRKSYDVLLFYHMWQTITPEQEKLVSGCIASGKPVVALHHSICAFDEWPEYWNIIGGKYFHKETEYKGKVYEPCSYIHDLNIGIDIVPNGHPVTKGLSGFTLFDETYKGYYVADDVTPLLTTGEPSSNSIVGWAKRYGKARIVVLQSGHDSPTFASGDFRKLLRQSIKWVSRR